jgi:hypothetical protein
VTWAACAHHREESRDSAPEALGFFRALLHNLVTEADVLFAKFVLPSSVAATLCDPAVNVDVLKVAVRVGSSVSVPSVVAPCLKATVPVGVLPLELTAAVKVSSARHWTGSVPRSAWSWRRPY